MLHGRPLGAAQRLRVLHCRQEVAIRRRFCRGFGKQKTVSLFQNALIEVALQTNTLLGFVTKTRRQRINQRNRTERVSELLDWKSLGNEYIKARQLALRRAYPESFDDDEPDFTGMPRIGAPLSAPGSPRFKSGMMTPGDLGE